MSPFSPLVLVGAALVSSPALWASMVGRQDVAVGLSRYLVSVALCWAAGSVLAMLVGPPPRPVPSEPTGEREPVGGATPE